MKTTAADKQVNVRINPEDLAMLGAIAYKEDSSHSQVIRSLIRQKFQALGIKLSAKKART